MIQMIYLKKFVKVIILDENKKTSGGEKGLEENLCFLLAQRNRVYCRSDFGREY